MSATVLASARCVRSVALCRHGLRTLATEALQSSSSSSTPQAEVLPDETEELQNKKTIKLRKSAYVRSWDPISNMAEFFAMLRGVEKRFGSVRDFRLLRVSVHLQVIHVVGSSLCMTYSQELDASVRLACQVWVRSGEHMPNV